jgi:hypothetical protein
MDQLDTDRRAGQAPNSFFMQAERREIKKTMIVNPDKTILTWYYHLSPISNGWTMKPK